MRDNIIINIISKIYFNIVSLFLFIFLLLFIGFIVLQNGLFINEVSISNIGIKQLYIKWNEKLDVSFYEMKISQTQESKNSNLNYEEISHFMQSLARTSHWFNSVVVENIFYKDIKASFNYNSNDKGFFLASSKDLEINVAVSKEKEIFLLKFNNFYDKKKKITLSGNIYIDAMATKLYTNVNLAIADELDLTLYTLSDLKSLYYKLTSNKKILDYKHTVSLANLPKEAQYWAYDAIEMSYLDITHIGGFVEYEKSDEILKNINITATAHKLNYAYHKDLDEIHTQETKLEFKSGSLFIYPQGAYTDTKQLADSWISIDFTQKEEQLALHLLFDAALDEGMLKILNAYKINLPFLQKKGEVKTDLLLEVGLRKLHVHAVGNFYTKKANFDYLGLNIDIGNANIFLNNYDVTIKNMDASYKDMAKASVDVVYNAASAQGKIDFKFKSITTNGLSLNSDNSLLHATYNIHDGNDSIEIANSEWLWKEQSILVDSLQVPFDLNELKLNIPTTYIEEKSIGNAFISGVFDINTMTAKLSADILKFSYEGVRLSQSNTPLKISYDKKFSIFSKNEIFFNISGSNYKMTNFYIEFDDDEVFLKHTKLNIGKYITTKVYANLNLQTNKSHISLSNFTLINPKTKNILYKKKKILLSLSNTQDLIKIRSREIEAEFTSDEKGWKLKLNSLARMTKNSSLLTKFHLDKGNFTVYKNRDDKYTRFKANIKYPYKILVKNNKPIEDYKIKGRIYKDQIDVNVNNKINIILKDTIDIRMKNTTVNIKELLRVFEETSTHTNTSKVINVLLHAKDSKLYITDTRHILYDALDMQYYKKILTAQLTHSNGEAGLRFKDGKFHLYGKKFNAKFMNRIFSLSKFTKGSLDFSLNGDIDNYDGVIYIRNSIMNDYNILNNILAFVNTIPSLVTFQLPGYSKDGLLIHTAYLNFNYKDEIFNLTDINLDSKEIDIVGQGTADLEKDNLDIILNLKTDLGSDFSKIPLVGYIILDGDRISTTLSIKGKTSDPDIKSLLAKDIVLAPVNIIKRTLSLPYLFIKNVVDD